MRSAVQLKNSLNHWMRRKAESTEPSLSRTSGSHAELDLHFVPDIPQASVIEQQLQKFEERDWRRHFSSQLNGLGLEIGPLHRPLVTHPGMRVEYIDRLTVAELREHYPELNQLPLIEPDILGDAETLDGVPNGKYDFLVSAHVIEHMRNPIGSLLQWFRVLKPGGLLYLIVPDKRATFDKHRVRTTLAHLILDYVQPSRERDFEHFLDYAIHVDRASQWDAVEIARQTEEKDYSIHFHVFLPTDIFALLCWFSEKVLGIDILEGPCMSPGSDEFHFLLQLRK